MRTMTVMIRGKKVEISRDLVVDSIEKLKEWGPMDGKKARAIILWRLNRGLTINVVRSRTGFRFAEPMKEVA